MSLRVRYFWEVLKCEILSAFFCEEKYSKFLILTWAYLRELNRETEHIRKVSCFLQGVIERGLAG